MATKDTTTTTDDDTNLDDVETTDQTVEDETTEEVTDDVDEGDTEDSDQDDDDEDHADENSDDDQPKFEKRFTQFKGATPEEYHKQVEDAYLESSKEGERLGIAFKDLQGKYDSIISIVAKDPEMAKKINEATADGATPPTVDPALAYARDNMEKQMASDYNEFVEAHPELESDPALRKEMLAAVTEFGEIAAKKGQVLTMAQGLKKAWAYLGKEDDSEEKVVTKAKEQAGKPKTQSTNTKSKPSAPQFTDDQLAVAKKMGVSVEQLTAAAKKK